MSSDSSLLRRFREIDQAQKEVQISKGCITCENSLLTKEENNKNTVPISIYMCGGQPFRAFLEENGGRKTRLFRIEDVSGCTATLRLLDNKCNEIICTNQTCVIDINCVCCIQCFEGICCEPCGCNN